MKKYFLLLLITLLFNASHKAYANESCDTRCADHSSWYLKIDGDTRLFHHSDEAVGTTFGCGVGYRFLSLPGFRTEASMYGSHFSVTNGDEITSVILTANGYYDILNKSKFTPYVGFGLGAKISQYSYKTGWHNDYYDDNETKFVFQPIVGLSYKVCKALDVGIEYKSVFVDSFNEQFGLLNLFIRFNM